jgi:hypothetical protein
MSVSERICSYCDCPISPKSNDWTSDDGGEYHWNCVPPSFQLPAPKNPEVFTFRCRKCEVNSLELNNELPDEWLMLEGYGMDICYFCSMICMFFYLGNHPFGLEQMSIAVKGVVNDKYFRKGKGPKGVSTHIRKRTKAKR